MDAKSLMIVVLIAAVGVLGYLYYESQQPGISIKAPGVDIEAK
jgi:predicted negative regulator of RcsB-dependent stress response